MSDRRDPEDARSTQERIGRTRRPNQSRGPYDDPAYGDQHLYHPGSSLDPNPANTTDKLPRYWSQNLPPSDQPPHDPELGKPKAPRWLWIAAGAAVVLVAALVIALLIANGTARRQTAVPALPSTPSSQQSNPAVPRSPSATARAPGSSTRPADPGSMQAVVYNVSGDGRAISITYVDNDGLMQTEFNVALPWIKEVSLPESGGRAPNVTVVNIGHDVTCSVTVDGVEINQRTGVGLTVCNGNN